MALEETKLRSRRALLAGATAGVAVLAAQHLGRPLAVRAADGDPVFLGQWNEATGLTEITNNSTPGDALLARSTHGIAIKAESTHGPAIACGSEDACAVIGESTHWIAVQGNSFGTDPSDVGIGVQGNGGSIGVQGGSDQGHGVEGSSDQGLGVCGSSKNGTAVMANIEPGGSGTALDVHGPVYFDSAGRVTIGQGAHWVTVHPLLPLDVDKSKILVTLLGNPTGSGKKAVPVYLGYVQITDSATFDIVLTGPAGRQVDAAFFVIN